MKIHKIKKGFTLLELIIVMAIISTLIVTLRRVFVNTNKEFLYSETCINKVHGDMNNFVYAAMTSKGLYAGSGTIFPKKYIISIIPDNEIKLSYVNSDDSTGIYLSDLLSGQNLEQHYCSMNNYYTKLSGDQFDVEINKASIQDQTLPTFTINSGSEVFLETAKMYLCYKDKDQCKEIANFIVDIRTQSIQKKKCTLINQEDSDCLKRDQ